MKVPSSDRPGPIRRYLLVGLASLLLASATPLAAGDLTGRYRLEPDGRLVGHALILEFFADTAATATVDPDRAALPESKSGLWSARIAGLPDPDGPRLCRQCPGTFRDRPLSGLKILQGLRERDAGEFLYGRLVLPGQSAVLRCKVWRRGANLYLRIYEEHHYSTHRLKALP